MPPAGVLVVAGVWRVWRRASLRDVETASSSGRYVKVIRSLGNWSARRRRAYPNRWPSASGKVRLRRSRHARNAAKIETGASQQSQAAEAAYEVAAATTGRGRQVSSRPRTTWRDRAPFERQLIPKHTTKMSREIPAAVRPRSLQRPVHQAKARLDDADQSRKYVIPST